MKLIIHRGTHEIGGSCVELISDKSRIVIDIGMPLITPGSKDERPFNIKEYQDLSGPELVEAGILPPVRGLYEWESGAGTIDAVLLSHAHQDHYGFAPYIRKDIPVYASRGTIELLNVSAMFLPYIQNIPVKHALKPWETVNISDFTVKPYLVDHSAPDALAFEINTDSARIFYSGDIRAHGRKSVLFQNLLKHPPQNIDALLLEGTMMSRPGPQRFINEEAIERALFTEFSNREKVHFIFSSSQNIDRFCSIYRALKQSRGTLIIDLYTAYILERMQTVSRNIPNYDATDIHIKYWKRHADILAESGNESFLYKANHRKIKLQDLPHEQTPIVVLARANHLFDHMASKFNAGTINLIWSQWHGYLTGEDIISSFACEHDISIKQIHTSGHATTDDLKMLTQAIKPSKIVPIHTCYPEMFHDLSDNVTLLNDGEVYSI